VRWRSLDDEKSPADLRSSGPARPLRSVRYRTDTPADPDHARAMQLKLPARTPLWLIAVSFCSLAVWGSVAILRSIPASYANIPAEGPAEGTMSRRAALSNGGADAYTSETQSHAGAARPTSMRATCSECGVVESIREIAGSEIVGRQNTIDVTLAGHASGGAIVARPVPGKSYDITVRFRDGSTTVFNEAGTRTWRVGSRVILIGHSIASN
jgi:hypothetical protein